MFQGSHSRWRRWGRLLNNSQPLSAYQKRALRQEKRARVRGSRLNASTLRSCGGGSLPGEADPAATLKSTAGVVCAALQASALSSSAFVELGDDEVSRFEASLYRSSLTETLVASRLYGQMVKAKRNALRGDNGQYLLSFLDSGKATVNGSGRPEINYAAMTRDVIREAGEGSRKAKSIFCGLEKHLGEDTALTAVHWMDDMNCRGSQVGVFWDLAVGKNASPKDGAALMTFMESLYGASDLVDRLNEATRKAGIQHVAVVGGAQMGYRPVVAAEKSATNGSIPVVARVAPALGQAAALQQGV